MKGPKGKRKTHKDLDWWVRRYKYLYTTKAEEVVRKAAKTQNRALKAKTLDEITRRAEKMRFWATQLEQDIDEAKREITRLGGAALVEELHAPGKRVPTGGLFSLYRSLRNQRLVKTSEEIEQVDTRAKMLHFDRNQGAR